jgi:hypothetical protein
MLADAASCAFSFVRTAPKLAIVALFDRRIEGVHIDMDLRIGMRRQCVGR